MTDLLNEVPKHKQRAFFRKEMLEKMAQLKAMIEAEEAGQTIDRFELQVTCRDVQIRSKRLRKAYY